MRSPSTIREEKGASTELEQVASSFREDSPTTHKEGRKRGIFERKR